MPGLVKDWRKARVKSIDEWLERAPEFSRPIRAQLREWIFEWEPDLVESIKWNMASFSAAKLVCVLGAFKKHATIFFPRGTELPDQAALFNQGTGIHMRAIRITTFDGFNRAAFRALLRAAVVLDSDPAIAPPSSAKREPLLMPAFFKKALKENPKSAAGFKILAPTYQREYINWLTTAKRPETRAQRLAVTLSAVAAGRKYADRRLA